MVSALRGEVEGDSTASKMIEVNRRASRLPRSEREPPFPLHDAYIFGIFQELNASRSHNGFGYNPLSYTEVDAYRRMTGTVLNAWQVKMLMRIDQIFLAASAKAQQIKANTPASSRAKR
jgi:hypothetical protein